MVTRLVLTLLSAMLLSVATAASDHPPYGFEAMEHYELLPLLAPNGTQTKQFVSYDTSGGNADGGIERFTRYDEKGECVFFDEIGPGCLYRQQMNAFTGLARFPSEQARIRMYFDDESKPRLDMTFADYFGKGQKYSAPFTPPLSFADDHGVKWFPNAFANSYYPFPFRKRLKITAYRPGGLEHNGGAMWYQYTYHKYPSGTPVESWAGRQVDSQVVRRQWDQVGEDPKGATGNQSISRKVSVPRGKTVRVLDLKGQGSISSLRIAMDPWTTETFYHTNIRIAWDKNPPAVDMPIGCFFGGGGDRIGTPDASSMTLKTELFGFDGKTRQFYSYWPMPYWSRARIEITNNSPVDIAEMRVDVAYKPSSAQAYPRESCGYFCATRTVDISPDDAYYSRAFAVRGRGKVMGIMMYSTGYAMDGDEFTYIDDSRTPQIHGDGTEDDHNQGFGGYAIQKPYWGGLINGFQGGYRLYVNDSYIFNSKIDIRYEHSNAGGGTSGQKTDCVVWYYLAEPGFCNLKLTDELDVGKTDTERAHSYFVSGETLSTTTLSSYDKYEQGDPWPTKDDGRAFNGHSSFRVNIDPENEGVKLRRRANRSISNIQKANVYVDGVLIPDTPWYICDLPAPPQTAFVDTDFEIPARHTKGKDHVTIRVEHVAGQKADSNSEYYYWVYSYERTRLPDLPPEAPGMLAKMVDDGSAVELTWSDPSENAKRFVIERREEQNDKFKKVATLRGGSSSYRDEKVEPLTTYVYRIQAGNRTGVSAWSQAVVVMAVAPRAGVPNLSAGAVASASSEYGTEYAANKATDRRLNTRWNSAKDRMAGEWIAIDLGKETRLNTVLVCQETYWTRITSYTIQCWINAAWKDVYHGTDMADAALCRFDPVKTSKIRLLINRTNGNTPTIKEFAVYDLEERRVR